MNKLADNRGTLLISGMKHQNLGESEQKSFYNLDKRLLAVKQRTVKEGRM